MSEPKIRGYRKRMLRLWLQRSKIQRLVDQENTILRNIRMTELEIEELQRKITGSDSVIVEQARSVEARSGRRRCEKCFVGNGSRRAGW